MILFRIFINHLSNFKVQLFAFEQQFNACDPYVSNAFLIKELDASTAIELFDIVLTEVL